MGTDKVSVIGIHVSGEILSRGSNEEIVAYISNKTNIYGRILFTLSDYLTKYTNKFDDVFFAVTNEVSAVFPNGSLTGVIRQLNRSEIDIGVLPISMNEIITEIIDFSYPYQLYTATFVTQKAEYKPQLFGIFQTFSLPLWTAILTVLIVMSAVYYITFKRRYSFDKISLHAFAVLLRQSSILKPSSVVEKMLVFSWVLGAMFLCLAYDSVFLSFLSFPPVTQVKDVPQLAKAVKERRFHCIADQKSAILRLLLNSKQENLKLIGRDIETNNLSNGSTFKDFLNDKIEQDIAFLVDTNVVNLLTVGKKFVSEDRFLDGLAAMPVRKNFCCKKLVEIFVHRLMASGLFFKYQNDKAFLIRMPRLLQYEEKDTSKRKLTLTDVAPAFIFLIFGHIISFLVLIVEIVSNRLKKKRRRNICKDSMHCNKF